MSRYLNNRNTLTNRSLHSHNEYKITLYGGVVIAVNVVRTRVCHQCGIKFLGGPRAWYCPSCRINRAKMQDALRRQNGTKRPLGSIDRCEICGDDYVVKSGAQRYCPKCAPDAVRRVDNLQSRAWNEAHKETYYPARNAKRRAAEKPCIVCGKMFLPNGLPTNTCSPECRRERKRQIQKASDLKRRGDKRGENNCQKII